MGTFQSFRKAYGALKDSTKVGLAKVNSEFKDLDIAIVKATNHVEVPPKERHVRRIFSATSAVQPRADVAYCIHALSRRISKTKNWIVALKTLIVIHRTLREGDPTFREELLNYSPRGHILQMTYFKDDSSPLAWDCSAWVRTYALFLEERLECFRVLKYDIETERLTKTSPGVTNAHSRTRLLSRDELLEQLPALQQLLYRLIGCQPEGAAFCNYLIQYALALVLKESFRIYCAINDGIINLVDMFFDMSRHDAVKALEIYKRAGQQAENLADFYDYCKGLDVARNFHFPMLRQPPPSFLSTMEEYIREAPQTGLVIKRLEYRECEPQEDEEEEDKKAEETPQPEEGENEEELEKVEEENELINAEEQLDEKEEPELAVLSTEADLLGLCEVNPRALELEESNAMALAIVSNGSNNPSSSRTNSWDLMTSGSGWELALVTTPSNNTHPPVESKLAGGFDKLLLDSLYEDEAARRQIQLTQAGYGYGQNEHEAASAAVWNPFEQHHDPFMMSYNIPAPTNVQMAMMAQQQQHMVFQQPQQQQQQQHMVFQQPQQQQYGQYNQNNMMMIPHHQQGGHPHQRSNSNPFGDPFPSFQQQQHQNHHFL